MAVKIDAEECTGCGSCVDVCPLEAIELVNGKAVVDKEKCVDCGACVDQCPTKAISLDDDE